MSAAKRPRVHQPPPRIVGEVKSLSKFVETIISDARRDPTLNCYRGQSNAEWPSVPGIFRPHMVGFSSNEQKAVRDLFAVYPSEFFSDTSMLDRLVRMQHFGLPTRLMDVTRNPLVALYFAVSSKDSSDGVVASFSVPPIREKYYDSDSVSVLSNLSNLSASEKDELSALVERTYDKDPSTEADTSISPAYNRLIESIKIEKSYFLPRIDLRELVMQYYVHPKMSNRRIIAQSGAFIIYGLDQTKSSKFRHVIRESRYIVPSKYKFDIRRSLELIGIKDDALFPELERAAKNVEARYSIPSNTKRMTATTLSAAGVDIRP